MHGSAELPTARLGLGEISVNPGISARGRVSLIVRVLSLSLEAYAGSCGQVLHTAYPEPVFEDEAMDMLSARADRLHVHHHSEGPACLALRW